MARSSRPGRGLLLAVTVARDWDRVEPVRIAIEHLLRAATDESGELAAAMSMAASELLENAVKYGAGTTVSLRLAREDGRIVLAVTNRTNVASDRSTELHRYVSWLREHEDPLSAYCALVSTIAASQADARSPGLGLARIVHAGGCDLSCDLSVAGEVTLRASRLRASATRGASRKEEA